MSTTFFVSWIFYIILTILIVGLGVGIQKGLVFFLRSLLGK